MKDKNKKTASLSVDVTSMFFNGEKLEGEKLIKFLENMSETDRRTLVEDMVLCSIMDKEYLGPTPCSHCGGNGYEP